MAAIPYAAARDSDGEYWKYGPDIIRFACAAVARIGPRPFGLGEAFLGTPTGGRKGQGAAASI